MGIDLENAGVTLGWTIFVIVTVLLYLVVKDANPRCIFCQKKVNPNMLHICRLPPKGSK
jgi:hypothetical protein